MERNKQERQEMVRQLIRAGRLGNQEKLLGMLQERGIRCTQATLSRDLHEMKVVKLPDGGNGYVYLLPDEVVTRGAEEQLRVNYLADGFRELRMSGNLAVIRTFPGYASSIAAVIDAAQPAEILGTVAGDDTILVILTEGTTRSELTSRLVTIMPYLKTREGF